MRANNIELIKKALKCAENGDIDAMAGELAEDFAFTGADAVPSSAPV